MITFSQTNDYKESIALHENLLPRARKKGNKLREIVHYNTIANAYLQLGTLDKALLYFQKDYELSVENGDKVDVATTLYGMSNVYEKKGDFEKAIDVMRRGMEMHKETGDASGEAVACVNLAGILLSSLSSLQRDRKALKRNQEECWRLHTEAIATYQAGLELAETFLQSGAAENSTTSSVVKEAKVKALLELSNIEMGHLFRTQTASDFRASAHRAQEELDQIESRLRSALEFEIDHRVVLRLMASVAYARGADEEVLDLMRQCFDLHMSMSRGRLAACQYCGQLRGDHAEMLTCGSCRVSCYCCAEHQRLAWIDSVRFGASSVRTFSGHKHLCPLLKEWRLISKGQGSHAALNPAVLQYIDNVSGFKKEDKDEEGWETEEGEDEEEEEQAADDAQARPESGAATVAQEPQQREQQQRADQTQTEKQSSEQEAAEGPTREELEKKSIKELREMCKSKGLDYSSCVDKNDMVHLISSNPHATAPAGMGEAPASASAAGSGAAYEYGDVVTVIGLQSKPQHNGKVAKVLQRQKDRFQVQIQDDAMASMALRPSNLEPEVIS
jgi:tetratricopeptide (TPR) repeat protein